MDIIESITKLLNKGIKINVKLWGEDREKKKNIQIWKSQDKIDETLKKYKDKNGGVKYVVMQIRSFGVKCIISLNEKYSEDGILQKLYTCLVCGTILYKNTIDSKAIDKLYERIQNRKNMLQKVQTSNKRKNNIASRRK